MHTEFTYRFEPGAEPDNTATLLLLHGTGGDETSLLGLGRVLLPGANALSPRGRTLEHGKPRFFRRLSEGVFDQEDLAVRTAELERFVASGAGSLGFDPARVIAVGYSNGANIAASMLLRGSRSLAAAVLFHPMTPFVPDEVCPLPGIPVLISAGHNDPIVATADTERLAGLLERAGAQVTIGWGSAGHALERGEIAFAHEWLSELALPPGAALPLARE